VPTILTPIPQSPGILAKTTREEEKIKGIHIGKEEVKQSLFSDNIILDLQDLKYYTQKNSKHHKQLQQNSRIQNQFTINQQLFYTSTMNRLRKNIGKQFLYSQKVFIISKNSNC
jgi:hypothetical protein